MMAASSAPGTRVHNFQAIFTAGRVQQQTISQRFDANFERASAEKNGIHAGEDFGGIGLDSAAVDRGDEARWFIGRWCKLDAAPRAIEEDVIFHRLVTRRDLPGRGVSRVSTSIPAQR